ncbi:MAG: hypothetical protein RJB66_1708 [Pseudomonadota bacterium]|jgi:magnesium transporter
MSTRSVIKDSEGLIWIDLINPSREELAEVARQFGLHPSSVDDCLDPSHLPKVERIDNHWFFILRVFDEHSGLESDTVQELTRKVALFLGPQHIISIHRTELSFINGLIESLGAKGALGSTVELKRPLQLQQLFFELISRGLNTFNPPLDLGLEQLSKMENQVFLQQTSSTELIRSAYFLKSRVFIIKRMVRMISDGWTKVSFATQEATPWMQEIRDTTEDLLFYCEDLLETTHQLMNLHLSLQSHRTNEVMRILTVFSVIFLPLNLIAGIYGMNFEFMPELKSAYGYPLTLILMAVVAGSVAVWIVKKGWLGER